MKTTFFTILTFLFVALGTTGSIAETALDRLNSRSEISGWEAVGRVNVAGGGFCTGALITPDLVLTAAHCLVQKNSGKAVDPAKIEFSAGYSNGNSIAVRRAMQTVVHPDYVDASSPRYDSVSTDIGLIKLQSPIPTNIASPFAIGEQSVGREVSVVSYARGRAEALSWQRTCSVKAKWDAQGAAAFSCDVNFGSSGAPVFDTTRRRPMIVSVISRGRREGNESIAFGPLIQKPIAELKEALRISKGVNTAGGGLASVVRQTQGARFVKAGKGARFVKP